ncbi:DEAD/DEAH box helicase, partial [Escherichia coli]|uniref:DEAD/DEAH box helicase n=2 Tax=Enterobacterales TaxID=91347 RepID=UPI0019D17EDE
MPVSDDFAENGILTRTIPGFHPREAQRQMAKSIIDIIDKQGVLIAEAGTGTGKTYAYLVPALRSGKKTIISTGSKALQDQLYNRDLPTIIKAINYDGNTALLKGRSNYLCLERLEQQMLSGGDLEAEVLS